MGLLYYIIIHIMSRQCIKRSFQFNFNVVRSLIYNWVQAEYNWVKLNTTEFRLQFKHWFSASYLILKWVNRDLVLKRSILGCSSTNLFPSFWWATFDLCGLTRLDSSVFKLYLEFFFDKFANVLCVQRQRQQQQQEQEKRLLFVALSRFWFIYLHKFNSALTALG